jgi:hypothetical protein
VETQAADRDNGPGFGNVVDDVGDTNQTDQGGSVRCALVVDDTRNRNRFRRTALCIRDGAPGLAAACLEAPANPSERLARSSRARRKARRLYDRLDYRRLR